MNRPLRAFTLIELLVVIAIIGTLSSVILASLNTARTKADIARAQADLRTIASAIHLLEGDTGLSPRNVPITPCIVDPEVYIDQPAAGLVATDGSFPNWDGPYLPQAPLDPWGTNYYFDSDYICGHADTVGCEGTIPNEYIRAVVSFGPDKTQSYYSGDDIVYPLCRSYTTNYGEAIQGP